MGHKILILGFANDLIGANKVDVNSMARTLIKEGKEVGLKVTKRNTCRS